MSVNQLNDKFDNDSKRYSNDNFHKTLHISGYILISIASILGIISIILSKHYFMFGIGIVILFIAGFYSSGIYSYSNHCLGEILVFLVYGPIYCIGSQIQISNQILITPVFIAIILASGFLNMQLLMVDNIRDIKKDLSIDKKTIMNRLGEKTALKVFEIFSLLVCSCSLLIYVFSDAKLLDFIFPALYCILTIILLKKYNGKYYEMFLSNLALIFVFPFSIIFLAF